MPITVLDLAIFRGAKPSQDGSYTSRAIENTGLPFMGGCITCGATVAAYNACPTPKGCLKCLNECIGDDGFDTVEAANKELFGPTV